MFFYYVMKKRTENDDKQACIFLNIAFYTLPTISIVSIQYSVVSYMSLLQIECYIYVMWRRLYYFSYIYIKLSFFNKQWSKYICICFNQIDNFGYSICKMNLINTNKWIILTNICNIFFIYHRHIYIYIYHSIKITRNTLHWRLCIVWMSNSTSSPSFDIKTIIVLDEIWYISIINWIALLHQQSNANTNLTN